MRTTILRFLLTFLLIEFVVSARKIKRRENYLSVPPPPPQPSSASSQHPPPESSEQKGSPYQYEEVKPNDFSLSPPPVPQNHRSHHNHQSSIQRFESELVSYHHPSGSGGDYLIDNGLRSIAKGSADQAHGAVASQNAAGKQAAYVAKSTLAQAAAQAAGTAVTALKGKEVLLHRLEAQSVDAHKSLENELAQLHQAKRAAKTAQYSAQQAINHVSVLTAALNNAQAASEIAQKSASEAAAELSSQIDMVAQAKSKLEQIDSQVYGARLDYEETKDAAEKATLSAQEAQLNANDAALHANVELNDSYGHSLQEKQDEISSEASSLHETKRSPTNRRKNKRRNNKDNSNK